MHQGITSRHPKILFLDLETMPDLHQVLKVYPSISDFYGKTFKADITTIICFGYMFLTDKKPKCASIWDRKYKNINDDYILVKTAHDILQDVELIVTYNGKKFDLKHLNTRIMPPLS